MMVNLLRCRKLKKGTKVCLKYVKFKMPIKYTNRDEKAVENKGMESRYITKEIQQHSGQFSFTEDTF
jgi:hypothetical protein